GVTRGVVLGIADELGMAVEREGVEEFEPDDSAFLTNSTWGVREVSDVGGITLDTSAEVERVSEAYYDRVLPSCSTD
ncbi:MAG: aminodeoxychorismate lyase, partial [Halobacteria archaeon]|nr:aminodeoxychorismate lyase [Halobacteria archaeon]